MTEDEKFFAWLDGELGPAEAAEIEARVARDPELARLAEQHRKFGSLLGGAFAPIATAPVPEHLAKAVRPSAEIIDLAARTRSRKMALIPQWAALAATLAVGILAGTLVPRGGSAPIEVEGGKIYAAAAL